MDIAAAVSDFFGTDTDNLTFREHGLYLTDCKSVIFITILRQDDAAIYDQKIQIRGDRKVAVFSWCASGNCIDSFHALQIDRSFGCAELMNDQLPASGIYSIRQGVISRLGFFIERVSRLIRIDAGNFTGTDEAGNIIDMSICLVGIDAVLDPDDRIDIQIIF